MRLKKLFHTTSRASLATPTQSITSCSTQETTNRSSVLVSMTVFLYGSSMVMSSKTSSKPTSLAKTSLKASAPWTRSSQSASLRSSEPRTRPRKHLETSLAKTLSSSHLSSQWNRTLSKTISQTSFHLLTLSLKLEMTESWHTPISLDVVRLLRVISSTSMESRAREIFLSRSLSLDTMGMVESMTT